MKKVKRYTWELVLALALLAGLIAGAAGQRDDAWHDKLIRLHVVANSDSEADQAQKLRVRDAVLAAAEPLLAGVDNAAAARQTLQAHLPQLEQAAIDVLEGSGYTAAVTLRTVGVVLLLLLSIAFLVGDSYNPFLYFRF